MTTSRSSVAKKVSIEMKHRASFGDYCADRDSFAFCGGEFEDYFELDATVLLVVSTQQPRDNDYYKLTRPYLHDNIWFFAKDELSEISDESPWSAKFDTWLSKNFPKSKTIYVWVTET